MSETVNNRIDFAAEPVRAKVQEFEIAQVVQSWNIACEPIEREFQVFEVGKSFKLRGNSATETPILQTDGNHPGR